MNERGEVRERIKESLNRYISLSGYTQKEIAEKLGVSKSSVTNWLKGKNSPDANFVMPICRLLNITVGQFYGEEENPPAQPKPHQGEDVRELMETLDSSLVQMGYIGADDDLTEQQEEVLIGICRILRATFKEK